MSPRVAKKARSKASKVQNSQPRAGSGDPPGATVVGIRQSVARQLLDRLDASRARSKALAVPSEMRVVEAAVGASEAASAKDRFTDRWNSALGCRTDEVALGLLAQIAALIEPRMDTASEERVDTVLTTATARIAELEPETATEGLLAVQMVGAQWAAMKFLGWSVTEGQTVD